MSTAGLPTFFKASKSKFNPARISMMMSANLLISAEFCNIELSIQFKQYGPNTIPTNMNPNSCGKCIFLNSVPSKILNNRINEKLNNIKPPKQKTDELHHKNMIQTSSAIQAVWNIFPGRHHFRNDYISLNIIFKAFKPVSVVIFTFSSP